MSRLIGNHSSDKEEETGLKERQSSKGQGEGWKERGSSDRFSRVRLLAFNDDETMADIDEANIDPYLHLGLNPQATEKDIKSAYRKKSLILHPDKVRSSPLLRSSLFSC